MPINISLLVAAPMLQDFIIDKTGIPMANGTITCYQDTSRTTLKNWYYQSGTPGNYTYITLPNPLTLSAAGTICDVNGVDTIPFFYPFSELDDTVLQPYYITIVNQTQTNQITRSNFPFIIPEQPIIAENFEFKNLIVNGGFWRNLQPNYANQSPVSIALNTLAVSSSVNAIVCPSQHDGFRQSDIRFIKNNTSGTDSLTFTPFTPSNSLIISNPQTLTPEYYISHNCSAAGSGETQKCYQFPIALHINNLANFPYTVSIQAQNAGGTSPGQNVINLYLYQDAGTGATSAAPILIANTPLTLTPDWQTYVLTDLFPSSVGVNVSLTEDDAFYLQVSLPFNTSCTINFTKPSIYLSTEALPLNDYQTYDEINAIISSPRTGDVRTSANQFYSFGWLPMNDGLIGLSNPGTSTLYNRANSDTWQLFSLLWNMGKSYDSGSNSNPLFQIYTNTAGTIAAANYGASAYADFTASSPSKALALPFAMGQVFIGTVPLSALLAANTQITGYTMGVTASNSSGTLLFTYSNASFLFGSFQGAPVSFTGTLPDAIVANAVYYIVPLTSSTFAIATTFANALAGTKIAYVSTSGSSIVANLFQMGASEGEYAHTQLLKEMVSHTHVTANLGYTFATNLTPTAGSSGVTTTTGSSSHSFDPATGPPANYTTQSGFNVTQPGTFMNIFIKL